MIRQRRCRNPALPKIELRRDRPCRTEPIDRLPYERTSLIDASSDLSCEFFETLGSKSACRPLCRDRQQRRHGEVEPRVKSNRLIRDPEIAIELFNLTAQSGEVTTHASGIADVVVRAEKAIKCCFDKRRFADTRSLGRLRQPCGHAFAEINANSGLHDGHSLGTIG